VNAAPLKRRSSQGASSWLVSLSLVVNVCLLVFKLYIVYRSRSLVVIASAVDSVLDLVAQFIILAALSKAGEVDMEAWPLGRSRLEPVGIIVVASLMGFASLQIVSESGLTLYEGFSNPKNAKSPMMDLVSVFCLLIVIVTKLVLYFLCMGSQSSSVQALAEDHLNDVMSNVVVLAAAWSAHEFRGVWFFDPVGAIGISLFIMKRWMDVGNEQAAMLVGRAAHPMFLERVAVCSFPSFPFLPLPDTSAMGQKKAHAVACVACRRLHLRTILECKWIGSARTISASASSLKSKG